MALVKTVDPKEATGKIGEIYELFRKGAGSFPATFEILSASPGLFEVYTGTFSYWYTHPTLGRELLSCIRYGVASQLNFPACIKFNEDAMRAAGMEEAELAAIREDPMAAPLEENERALLAFVLRSVKDPGWATEKDIDALRNLGWKDSDIVDATYHGAILTTMGVLMKAL